MRVLSNKAENAGGFRELSSRIEEATPPERDRTIDTLRGLSLIAVIVGHWLVTAIAWDPDGLVHGSPLATISGSWVVTWVFQVIPLFFVVGGYANAHGWSSARRRGDDYGTWIRGRLRRLLGPPAVAVGIWSFVGMLTLFTDWPRETILSGFQVAVSPLWFIMIYLFVMAATPITLAAHRRFGIWAVVALLAFVAANDAARFIGDAPWAIGILNYFAMWGGAHQLGYRVADGLSRRAALGFAAAGLVVVTAAIGWFDYPISMVGITGAERSNMMPPSAAVAGFTLLQFGVVMLARPALERIMRHPPAWAVVALANSGIMTAFLWHQVALLIVAGTAEQFAEATPGLLAPPDGFGWLGLRAAWILVFTAVLAPLVAAFRRVEARTR